MVELIFGIIGFYSACCCIFLGKAIADITSNEVHWKESIFSKKNTIDSFWGSKDHTWIRKDYENKLKNTLYHTFLVFTTDVWHLANTLRRIGIYLAIIFSMLIGNAGILNLWQQCIIILVFIMMNVVGFHVFYQYVLRKKKS